MEGLREEVEDLLWSAQVVEDDVMRQDVERLDQLKDRHPQIFFSSCWLFFMHQRYIFFQSL